MQFFENHRFIAHRGLHNDIYPENSLEAFENAIRHGYAFELDIYMTNDGTIVVHHDADLKRSCKKDISIFDLKGEQLKSFHIFGTKSTIPTLQNVLDMTQGKVPILIEIKDAKNWKKIIKPLMTIIKSYKGEVGIHAYHPLILRECYRMNKDIKYSYLCSKLDDINYVSKFIRKLLYSLALFKLSKATYISVKKDEITPKIIKKCNGNILPWVILNNDEANIFKNSSKGIIFENFLP